MTDLADDSRNSTVASTDADQQANWGGVLAMTLCVFAPIASEFMPMSLLTPIAAELQVSEGMAGQGIAISGVFAVVTSLSISWIARGLNRKLLLLGLTALMGLSGGIVSLAPNYLTYMLGRALIGVVIGGFWSMSAATAMRLVPVSQVPKALAIFNSGNALATVIAAPLGSYLGSIIGWRGAFLALVPIAMIALIWQWVALPSMGAPSRPVGATHVFRLLGRPSVVIGLAASGAFFMGQFTPFTYVRPFLETVTQVDVQTLSLILLLVGVAGFFGTALIGMFLKKSLYGTLIIITLLMALIALALVQVGEWIIPAAGLLGLWGLMATAAPVGWWSWVAQAMPKDVEAGGGLMVAVVQFAIASGSLLGGWIFDNSGYQSTFIASAAILMLGTGLIVLAKRESLA